jgi:hypothetical protein
VTDDEYRPHAERLTRNKTRRERLADKRNAARSQPGGIPLRCGCRISRTGHTWQHVTPCSRHRLLRRPITDEEMKLIA